MRWPFSKKRNSNDNQQRNEESASWVAFFRAIAERRREDPLIGAKLGAKEIVQRIMEVMKDEKGIHIQSLLCALGALAGYSCQASVREILVEKKGLSENQVFIIMEDVDGRKYFMGDTLNKPLAESQYSVWALAAGTAQNLGAKQLIDIGEVFEHVAGSLGNDRFGIPRIADDRKPGDIPCNYIKYLWPTLLPVVQKFCPAEEWPILFGIAIQEVMKMGKEIIDPLLALSIAMESAVPMSKVDFNSL